LFSPELDPLHLNWIAGGKNLPDLTLYLAIPLMPTVPDFRYLKWATLPILDPVLVM
jgi:hypothetical protein